MPGHTRRRGPTEPYPSLDDHPSSEHAPLAREGATFTLPPDPGDCELLYGTSPAIQRVRRQLAAVAARARRVRLEGERGTGKNLAAQYLHRLWRPPGAPFVELNVAAISAADGRELAEVFGHSIGAFTGAVRDLPGLLEEAHQGTAFLNELGTASATVQKVLLRVLDRGLDPRRVVRRLGEHRDRPLDIRVITATNEDLEAAVARAARSGRTCSIAWDG